MARRPLLTTVVAVAATAAACVSLGACGSPDGDAAASTSAPSTTLNSAFDYGTTVDIGTAGPAPAWLVTAEGSSVVWTNRAATAVTVTFTNERSDSGAPITSGPIAPGGTWTWLAASGASITYDVTGAVTATGQIQIMPSADGV